MKITRFGIVNYPALTGGGFSAPLLLLLLLFLLSTVNVSYSAELPRSRQLLYIFELEGLQEQYDATIRKGLVNDITELISGYGKNTADFNYKIGNLPSKDYSSASSALSAVDSFVKWKVPDIVPMAKDYMKNKSLDYTNIDYYFTFTENGLVTDKWIYIPVKIDRSGNITYLGARMITKPRYSFAYYKYISKRVDASLPSGWSISGTAMIFRYYYDLNGNVAVQNTFDVAGRYDSPEDLDDVIVDKKAGFKLLIDEWVKVDLWNEGIPYAIVDYGYELEPQFEGDGDSLTPILVISTIKRKFTQNLTTIETWGSAQRLADYCSGYGSEWVRGVFGSTYPCGDCTRTREGVFAPENAQQVAVSVCGEGEYIYYCCPGGEGPYTSEDSVYCIKYTSGSPSAYGIYQWHQCCSPCVGNLYYWPKVKQSQKDPNNGAYYNKHEIGWMLSMDLERYHVSPSGGYILLDKSNASGVSPIETKEKTVTIKDTSYTALSTKIIDPFLTTTIYDIYSDTVNNLPANRYTYLAPIEVE